jgi:adenosylcobinamide-GDP ribazoletransferase
MPTSDDLRDEFLACLGFYTRLPVPSRLPARGFAAAQWAAPLAGMVVAAAAWLAWLIAACLHVPEGPSAALALASSLLTTGCLHEDGLADTADGFGGGRTHERVLEIMRDSRIGTFGAAALVLSLLMRWSALAEMDSAGEMLAALVAAHAASRALIPALIAALPPARPDGLSAGVGRMETGTALAAGVIGFAALLLLGIGAALIAAVLLAAIFLGFRRLCLKKVGGQTGDTIGALQQFGEIAVLLVAAAA